MRGAAHPSAMAAFTAAGVRTAPITAAAAVPFLTTARAYTAAVGACAFQAIVTTTTTSSSSSNLVRRGSPLVTRMNALTPLHPFHHQRRQQGSLAKLLEDPSDPFLAAIMGHDLDGIAALAEAGPPAAGRPTHLPLHLKKTIMNAGVTAAATAEARNPLSTSSCLYSSSSSPAQAVLRSLHTEGLRKKAEHEQNEADLLRRLQQNYDALPEGDKLAIAMASRVDFLFDAMCALNSVLRTSIEVDDSEDEGEDSGEMEKKGSGGETPSASVAVGSQKGKRLPAEQLAPIWRVHDAVRAVRGSIPDDRWAADFAAEMAELDVFMRAMRVNERRVETE